MFITKQYMTLLNILFITAAAYLGVNALYKTLTAQMDFHESDRISVYQAVDKNNEISRPLTYYNNITARNLFNTGDSAKAKTAEPVQPDVTLEKTKLNLKLWGTVTGDQNKAYAVIEDAKKRMQDLYRKGENIQEGVSVKQILREQVILTVNGKDEILAMEKSDTRIASAASPGIPSPRTPFAASTNSTNIALDRSVIENAINNVNNLMRDAKIRPHFKDGKPDGLTLSRIKRGSIFTKLGLRSGDIITGVDGKKIESVDDALKFYNSLKSSDNVLLEIKRRGQSQSIEYNIQ
ncbi:putative general secretion pathway protein C [Desulfonema limicola]|uniref:General secretion pathway protein C n=1 Tax=Desulfonema limicola TaxID=45656 RepID=A0A975B4D4_9BACT|nr:type II secretion system protein GspC [Desulfonema limicola]QTA78563.1 putative general secretion pathway protein C [Desulfonema limicola]